MKVKHLIFSIIAAAFLTSAMSVDRSLEVGKTAPKIETIEGTNVGNDANSEGKNKLVSFWSPKKPETRIANRNLSRKYGKGSEENVEFITICTDSDRELMSEVMKIDGIEATKAYSSTEISPRVFKDYGVENAHKAYMISEDGKILEIL